MMERTEWRGALVEAVSASEALTARLRLMLDDIDGEEAAQVPRQGRWTKTMVAQLWAEVQHLPGIKALFEVAAMHPNEVVTYTQVLDVSGLAEMQQRNEHARMSRIAAELFGEKRWPIENWQGGADSTAGGKAEMRYRMGATVAGWWREIAGR